MRKHVSHILNSKATDYFIMLLIAINTVIVILETFSIKNSQVLIIFTVIELFSIIIFTVEYVMRLFIAPLEFKNAKHPYIKHIFSFMALIDILAILPFYLPFLIVVDLRALRMLRLFRLLRLMKVNRYTNSLNIIWNIIKKKKEQLLSSLFVVMLLILVSALIMYNFEYEAQPEVFENAFSGFWWAIATLTTVGYGDIYPITVAGKLLSSFIAILGIGLVAVPTGILSSGFVEEIQEEKEAEAKYCKNCGQKIG